MNCPPRPTLGGFWPDQTPGIFSAPAGRGFLKAQNPGREFFAEFSPGPQSPQTPSRIPKPRDHAWGDENPCQVSWSAPPPTRAATAVAARRLGPNPPARGPPPPWGHWPKGEGRGPVTKGGPGPRRGCFRPKRRPERKKRRPRLQGPTASGVRKNPLSTTRDATQKSLARRGRGGGEGGAAGKTGPAPGQVRPDTSGHDAPGSRSSGPTAPTPDEPPRFSRRVGPGRGFATPKRRRRRGWSRLPPLFD